MMKILCLSIVIHKKSISKNKNCIMSIIRSEFINARAHTLMDHDVHNDTHKRYEFKQKTILTDKSLTKDEKSEAISLLNKYYVRDKLIYNEGTKEFVKVVNQNV